MSSARINTILRNVRSMLSDTNESRWSTPDLISLIDEAQKDICKEAKILKKRLYLNIRPGIAFYSLPDDLIRLERVLYKGVTIPLKGHMDMDNEIPNWETRFGDDVECIVYDKLNQKDIRLYPCPYPDENPDPIVPVFGVVENLNGFWMQNILGVLSDVEISAEEISYNEVPYENSILFHYIRYPSTVVDVNSSLEISSVYDKLIESYVKGMALRGDMDTQNRTVGAEELEIYSRGLKSAKSDGAVASVNTVVETKYRAGVY